MSVTKTWNKVKLSTKKQEFHEFNLNL